MNVIILEDRLYKINSLLTLVDGKYPKSSVLSLNSENTKHVLKSIEREPLLTDTWLVKVYAKVSDEVIEILSKAKNVTTMYVFYSRKMYEEFIQRMMGLEIPFKIHDSTKLNETDLIEYTMNMLDIPCETAKYLCKRHRYYLPQIMNSINILSALDVVTIEDIKNYTTKYGDVSFDRLSLALAGYINPKDMNKTTIRKYVALIGDYRFGIEYMIDSMRMRINNMFRLYEYIDFGELNITNIDEFYLEHKKELKGVSKYFIERVIELRSQISAEYLYLVKCNIDSLKPNRNPIYKMINILKMSVC